MKKLELKHLAPYLPYGLKIYCRSSNEKIQYLSYDKLSDGKIEHMNKWEHKPILRPLSDLTKEELINAGFDYQIDWLTLEREYHVKRYESLEKFINKTDFGHVQYLISQHYDIFGLIEQGLAIDINTLNQEL